MLQFSRLVAAGKCAVQTTPLAVCVVLSLLSTVLWMGSYSTGYRYVHRTTSLKNAKLVSREFILMSTGGGFRVMRITAASADVEALAAQINNRNQGPAPEGFSALRTATYPRLIGSGEDSILTAMGIQYTSFRDQSDDLMDTADTRLTLPWWLVVSILVAYPTFKYVACVVRRQQEDRVALGLCPCCGEPVNEFIAACRGCDRPVGILTHA